MKVKKSDLAWVSVSELKQAKEFFTDVLGLSVSSSNEQFGWMELSAPEGGLTLGLGKGDQGPKPGSGAIVAYNVDDINAMKKHLEDKNVTIIGDIMEIPGDVKMLMFADPDGNVFHVVEHLK